MTGDQSPTARTKHGELTLDQIAEALPGMARLMVEISGRYWLLYYAAQGGNWELARHELGETRKALQLGAVVRPKYEQALAEFDEEHIKPLAAAIKARDFAALEAAYQRATERANEYHAEFGYPYIDWQLPPTPPGHLKLTPD